LGSIHGIGLGVGLYADHGVVGSHSRKRHGATRTVSILRSFPVDGNGNADMIYGIFVKNSESVIY
jgi:hypothetical protein